MTSFLVSGGNSHGGSFMGRSNLIKNLDIFLKRSPVLQRCHSASLHVVHDISHEALSMSSAHVRVVDNHTATYRERFALHRFSPNSVIPPGDLRWIHYQKLLAERGWDCAWMVDISDVAVLRLPRCSDRTLHTALAIGSDVCSAHVKTWLRKLAFSSGANRSTSTAFNRFLGVHNDVSRDGGRFSSQQAASLWQVVRTARARMGSLAVERLVAPPPV